MRTVALRYRVIPNFETLKGPAFRRMTEEELASADGGVVLAGAGVSMIAPTCLPSGQELLRRVIDSAVFDERLSEKAQSIFRDPRWQQVVPEMIFQRIVDIVGRLPPDSFAPFETVAANPLHGWIASLSARSGTALVTTNFDVLLSRDFELPMEVLHLHGRVDRPGSLVSTIREVGKGLPQEIHSRFASVLDSRMCLVVIGYSGNDRDVMQVVESHPPAKIIWVVRGEDDHALRNLHRLAELTELLIVNVDLARVAGRKDPGASLERTEPRQSEPDQSIRIGQQIEILVGCAQQIEQFEVSVALAEFGLLQSDVGEQDKASLSVLLSHAYNRLDDQASAERISRAALDFQCAPETRFRLTTQLALALIDAADCESLEMARPLIAEARELASSISEAFLGMAIHNDAYWETCAVLNGCGGSLAKAEKLYSDAIVEKRKAGDIRYLHSSLRNRAAVLESLGQSKAAEAITDEFLSIVERYDLRWERAYFPALRGWLLARTGQEDRARDLLFEARDEFSRIEDLPMVNKLTSSLARLE